MLAILLCSIFAEPRGDSFTEGGLLAGHDLDGDGIPDLVIGDQSEPERATIWFLSGKDGSVIFRRAGPPEILRWLEWVGDVDGDGTQDLTVAWGEQKAPWRVDVLSGRDGRLIRRFLPGERGFQTRSVGAAGDVDGDGRPDWIVHGAYREDPTSHDDDPIESWGWPIHGVSPRALTCAGVTAVRVVSGRDASVLREFWPSGPLAFCWWAQSLGDTDGDGRSEIAIVWGDVLLEAAVVVVHSGRDGAIRFRAPADALEPRYAASIDAGMDLDGDGARDLLIGSPFRPTTAAGTGTVHARSGRDGASLLTIDGSEVAPASWSSAWSFGNCVCFVRDVDGDGRPEILVGLPKLAHGALGAAVLCSGASGAPLLELRAADDPGATRELDRAEHQFGALLADAGDVDGDGIVDVAIAHVPAQPIEEGRVAIVAGKTGERICVIDRKSVLASHERRNPR